MMRTFRNLLTLSLAIAVATIFIQAVPGPTGNWSHLGSRKVNFGIDHDVIPVGLQDGSFSKLKVKVTGGALNMHKMEVVYGNGTRDELNVRHNFAKGDGSRVIDLNGGKRVIRKISFWYDTKNRSNRRATVHVFGRK